MSMGVDVIEISRRFTTPTRRLYLQSFPVRGAIHAEATVPSIGHRNNECLGNSGSPSMVPKQTTFRAPPELRLR